MAQDNTEFPRPNAVKAGASGSINALLASLARELVSKHLQGRRPAPQNQQSRPLDAHSVGRGPPIAFPGNTSSTRSFSSGSRQQNTAELHKKMDGVQVPARDHEGECKNPQCAQCGQVIIPLPKATFPFVDKPSITVKNWSIYTMKGPILLLDELDYLGENRFDFPLPEMIFGNNYVRLVNDSARTVTEFNTLDALDSLAPTSDFKVSYHKEWLSTRPKAKGTGSMETEKGLTTSLPSLESVKPYDWTYSTNYKGTHSGAEFIPSQEKIPIEKLLRPDPILFFDELILFEDELGDNGISMLSTKIRVMPSCLLLLCRFFLRVDDVAFRIRDTRIYVDFDNNTVLREYKIQDALYAELLAKVGRSSDPKRLLRDSNWVSQNIPVTSSEVEELVLE